MAPFFLPARDMAAIGLNSGAMSSVVPPLEQPLAAANAAAASFAALDRGFRSVGSCFVSWGKTPLAPGARRQQLSMDGNGAKLRLAA